MKLLQLNICMGKLSRQIVNLIQAEQPDILCLQEVFSTTPGQYSIDFMFNSLEILQPATGHEHYFFSPAFSLNISGNEVNFGNAIISKFPLQNQQTIFVSGELQKDPPLDGVLNTRNLQIAQIEVEGKQLTIANHHGYWQKDPMGNQDSVDCMSKVADSLRQVASPTILAGDFNVIPASPAMRVFDGFLEDLTATHNISDTLSSIAKVSGVPCDHILVSPEVTVTEFKVFNDLVSDHRVLILEFDL